MGLGALAASFRDVRVDGGRDVTTTSVNVLPMNFDVKEV
jgi:hypothetical protein